MRPYQGDCILIAGGKDFEDVILLYASFEHAETTNKGHGRIEVRECRASSIVNTWTWSAVWIATAWWRAFRARTWSSNPVAPMDRVAQFCIPPRPNFYNILGWTLSLRCRRLRDQKRKSPSRMSC